MTSPVKIKRTGRPPKLKADKPVVEKKVKKKPANGNIVKSRERLTPEQIEAGNDKQKKPNLKPSQIAEMEALWESGEVTLGYLSERFDRDQATISRHMSLKGIARGSKAEEYSRLVREKIAEELAEKPAENARRIKKMKDDHLNYNEVLNRLGFNELALAREHKRPMQSILPNVRALKELASLFALTRSESWALLGVIEFEQNNEKDDVPELLISELTSKDIEQMRIDQQQLASITGEAPIIKLEDIDLEELDSDIVEEGLE